MKVREAVRVFCNQRRTYQSWPTLKSRPTTLLESEDPTKRLHYQLHWAKDRRQVQNIFREFDSSKTVGIAFRRKVSATDYCRVLEKLSQTDGNGDERDGLSVFQQCLYRLHQLLESTEDIDDPLPSLFAIATLQNEFNELLSRNSLQLISRIIPTLVTRAVMSQTNNSSHLHINQITSALEGMILLCHNSDSEFLPSYGKMATVLCEIIVDNENILKETSSVDISCAMHSLQAAYLRNGEENIDKQKINKITQILGDHSVMRLAGTFSASQCTQVLSACVDMNTCHEGLIRVLSERLLQQHILDQITANEAATCLSALGDLSLEKISIKRLRRGCDTHGILPTTGLEVTLPKLTDIRSSNYEASWTPAANWNEDDSCVWSVQTLVAHKILRQMLTTRRLKTKTQICSILKGCALLGYSHPERVSAIHIQLLELIRHGDVPIRIPMNTKTGVLGIKPNALTGKGIPSIRDSLGIQKVTDTWQHTLLEANCFLSQTTGQFDEAVDVALSDVNGGNLLPSFSPMPSSLEQDNIWSDHTVSILPISSKGEEVSKEFLIEDNRPLRFDIKLETEPESTIDIRRKFSKSSTSRVWDTDTGEVDFLELKDENLNNTTTGTIIEVDSVGNQSESEPLDQNPDNTKTRHFETELRQSLQQSLSPLAEQFHWGVKIVRKGIELDCFCFIKFKKSLVPMVVYISSESQSATLLSPYSTDPTMNGLRLKQINKLTSICTNHLRPLIIHKELWTEYLDSPDKMILWIKQQVSQLGYDSEKPKTAIKKKKKKNSNKKKIKTQ